MCVRSSSLTFVVAMSSGAQFNVPAPGQGYACPYRLRAVFNEALAYCRRIGERFTESPGRREWPARLHGFPTGAVSRLKRYFNPQRLPMAETHHYRYRQWMLASGYEDPTAVRIDGEWLERQPDHGDDDWCPDCPIWRPRADASKALLPPPLLWPGRGA